MSSWVFRASAPGEGAIHSLFLVGEKAQEILILLGVPESFFLSSVPRKQIFFRIQFEKEILDEAMLRELSSEEIGVTGGYEISLHGSMAIVERVLSICETLGAARIDFSQWPWIVEQQGAIDRCQQEAWELLFEAKSLEAARFFEANRRGQLSRELKSLLETHQGNKNEFRSRLMRLLETAAWGIAFSTPRKIVIAGPVNAGKSTLFNCFFGSERVIVSPQAGTTRDSVRESFVLSGYPFEILDTAGIRQTGDALENLGIEETQHSLRDADLILWLCDGSQPLNLEFRKEIERFAQRPAILIRNKKDLGLDSKPLLLANSLPICESSFERSPLESLEILEKKILEQMKLPKPFPWNQPILFTARQLQTLQEIAQNTGNEALVRTQIQKTLQDSSLS